MKKILISILAVLVLLTASAYADMPSGMKDISYKAEDGEVIFSIPELYSSHGVSNIYRGNEFPYGVKITSGSEKTEYYTVKFNINGVEYDSADLVLSPGKAVTYEEKAEGVPRGKNEIEIKVVSGSGKVVSSHNVTVRMLGPLVDAYLEDYTRHLGLAGAFSLSAFNDVAQLNTYRYDMNWGGVEKQKGVYNINKNNLKEAEKYGVDAVVLLGYNNTLYAESGSDKQGIQTKENLDAFVNYAKAVQDVYGESPRLKYYEFYNEPNGNWRPRNMTDYSYAVEVISRSLKEKDTEAKLTIASTANGDYSFVDEALKWGAWTNIGAVVDHPYIRPTKVDVGYKNVLGGYAKIITKYGGWKPYVITEVGWPTHTAGVSWDQQVFELVKQVIVADWYGTDINQYYMGADGVGWSWYSPDNSEANFGIFYGANGSGGYELKPAAYGISNLTYETIGAVFGGKIIYEDEDIEAYLYLRDGEITCVIWSKGEEKTVTFEGESLRATDVFGNYVSTGNTFTIGESPLWLHGLSKKHLKNELSENIKYYHDTFLSDSFAESEGKKGFDKAKALVESTVTMAKDFDEKYSEPTEGQVLEGLKAHYNVSNQIIDMYASGELDITMPQLTGLLYANHWGAELWANVYLMSIDKGTLSDYTPSGKNAVDEVKAYQKEKAGENTMSYSEAILEYAKEFADKVGSLYNKSGTNPMKAGAVIAWDTLAAEIAKTAMKLAEIEAPGYENVFAQLPSSQTSIEVGVDQSPLLSVYNFRESKTLSGYVELIDPEGEVISATEKFELAAGESAQYPLNMLLTAVSEKPYTIRLVENGAIVKETPIELKGLEIFEAELQNATTGLEDLEKISVKFSDIVGRNFTGTLSIEPVCEWTLENAVDIPVTVNANESVTVDFKIKDKKSVTFHEYPFRIVVKNSLGGIVVNEIQLLSFQVFNKSKEELDITTFTGDMSFFKDAYPVYKEIPKDPTKPENWFDNGNYTRTMLKWTDENIYMAFDVTDWYHENAQVGYSIWNADSIQIFFDPTNSNGEKYDADDYQFGLALSEISPGKQVYAWHDPATGVEGYKPAEWTTIIRNHDLGITRYVAKFPKDAIPELKLSTGTVFSFDVSYNLSDLGTRTGFIEFTPGICDSHNVDGIWDFTLIDSDIEFDIEKDTILPVNIEGVTELEYDNTTTFTDIDGHWAKDDIIYGVKRGLTSGVSEFEFRPDSPIMRLEGCQRLAKIDNIHIWPTEAVYTDVRPDLYHAGFINSAKTMGIIPDEMIVNNRFGPGDNLYREEFFAMLAMYYSQKRGEEITGDMSVTDLYVDAQDISECYKEEVAYLLKTGILAGNEKSELRPKDYITKAEQISLIVRVVKAIEGGNA